ncbi:small heat shock protein [Pholiota conissans]|uniref:Small heat shock protein n=1 Tax=Pholiota conissans TaxID=109636 RepID=A0A9P5ZBA1_9AGAR|nr:small heat shock protein [Pholiota conissans]
MSNIFFYEPFYDLERLFDDAFPTRQGQAALPAATAQNQVQRNAPGQGAVRHLKPRMDLHEDTERNVVTATFELPGLKKEDVQIDVHNNRLTVSAESKQNEEYEENGFAVRERRFGKLSRTLQLPEGVKESDIKASLENGLLTVTFPKTGSETAPKKITIA